MYKVYVLQSLKSGKRYVGSTSQDLSQKLQEHNNGATIWTRSQRPLKLIYFEEFSSAALARKRERFLKTGSGRRVLDNLLQSSILRH